MMESDPTSTAETNLLYQKLVVGFSTLLISLLFGLLPYHLSRTSITTEEELQLSKSADLNNGHGAHSPYIDHDEEDPTMLPSWLSLATSFGGGVFLGAALLHLLPDASEVSDDDFPRANLLCSLGFLMVLALEEVMPHPEKSEGSNQNSSSMLALVAALSFHSLFDGLAIGSTTSDTQLKAVSVAILAHKPISAFALGSILVCKRLVSSKPDGKHAEFAMDQSQTSNRRQMNRRQSSSRRSMVYYYFKYAHDECGNDSCGKKECVCNDFLQWGESAGSTDASRISGVPEAAEMERISVKHKGYGSCPTSEKDSTIRKRTMPATFFLFIIFFSITSLLGTVIGAVGLQYIENSQFAQNYDSSSSNSSPPLGSIVAAVCQSLAAGSFMYAATMEALVKERGEHHRHHYHGSHDHEGHQTMQRTNRVGAALIGVIAMAAIKMLES